MSIEQKLTTLLSILLLVCSYNLLAQEQQAGESKYAVLYYKVRNVGELFSGSDSSSSTNELLGTEMSTGFAESYKVTPDRYLVPFIISEVDKLTEYKKIIAWDSTDCSNLPKKYGTLLIAINKFNRNLEYQFYYSIKEKQSPIQLIRAASFFINPENPGYPNTIKTEIQKLFNGYGGTNNPPIARIRIDGELIKRSCEKLYYRSNLDTIILDASSSYDSSTPKEFLEYHWTVKKETEGGYENAYLSGFDIDNSSQQLVINEDGKYIFQLQVSDGVATSEKESVKIQIEVILKPRLKIQERSFQIRGQRNLAAYILGGNKRYFRNTDSIGYLIHDLDPRSNLHLCYSHSVDQSRRFIFDPGFSLYDGLNTAVIPYSPDLKNPTKQPDTLASYKNIKLIEIDTCCYSNPGYSYFNIADEMIPGNHKYTINTYYEGVSSNVDTIMVSCRERSLLSIHTGYKRYWIKQGRRYFDVIDLDVLELGGRLYFTERISADMILMLLFNKKDYMEERNQNIGIVNLSSRISCDIFPIGNTYLSIGKAPANISGFLSTYQFNLSDGNELKGYRQWGIGIECRVELFSKHPNIGLLNLAVDFCQYFQFGKEKYWTPALGVKLIYGLWNY